MQKIISNWLKKCSIKKKKKNVIYNEYGNERTMIICKNDILKK